MTMIFEGDTQYEESSEIKRLIDKVVRDRGNTVSRIGRFALVLDEVYVSIRTPKPKKPKAAKKPPPRSDMPIAGVDAEAEQAESQQSRRPPHLIVCRWIKPPPAVQAHMQGAKLGKGQAQFLEVRGDLWSLMSDSDKEAAIMTALLQREIVDNEDGSFKVRKADLPVQTHPAVVAAYGNWWERMDPESVET